MFATVLYRTEPGERFLDATLVVIDNVLFDRRLEFLVAMVNTSIVNLLVLKEKLYQSTYLSLCRGVTFGHLRLYRESL